MPQVGKHETIVDRLDQLAHEINERLGAIERLSKERTRTCLESGRLLIVAKTLVPHGQFNTWATDKVNCKKSWRSILMRYARLRDGADWVPLKRWVADHAADVSMGTIEALLAAHAAWQANDVKGEGGGNKKKPVTRALERAGKAAKKSVKKEKAAAEDDDRGHRAQGDGQGGIKKSRDPTPLEKIEPLLERIREIVSRCS